MASPEDSSKPRMPNKPATDEVDGNSEGPSDDRKSMIESALGPIHKWGELLTEELLDDILASEAKLWVDSTGKKPNASSKTKGNEDSGSGLDGKKVSDEQNQREDVVEDDQAGKK